MAGQSGPSKPPVLPIVSTAGAFLIGTGMLVLGTLLLATLDAGPEASALTLLAYVVAGLIGSPRPFLSGLMLSLVHATLIVGSWWIDRPTFSLLGETPEPIGYQLLALLLIAVLLFGTLVTGVIGTIGNAIRRR